MQAACSSLLDLNIQPTLPSGLLFWLFCKEVSRPATWRSVSRKWLSWPLFWFSMTEESLRTDRAATEHRDLVCEWHNFWYPIITGGFALARRAQHSTLERRTWRFNVELELAKSNIALQVIVVCLVVGSHTLLDILMKYPWSMYITTKSKFTNLLFTTRNEKLTWKLGFRDVKWRFDRWSWKLICIYRHCVVKFEVDLSEYECWHDKLRCRYIKFDIALQLWFLCC